MIGYFEFAHSQPLLIKLLSFCYTSLTPLSAAALVIMGQYDRARFFATTFFYCAIAAMLIGAFYPAIGPVILLIEDFTPYQNFRYRPSTYHIGYLQNLRQSAGEILIYINNMPGLVMFPSFHTASGIILIVSFWRMSLLGSSCSIR